MNEFSSVLQVYKKNPAEICAADDNGDIYEEHEFLSEYEWAVVSELDGALRPVGPFIATLEASEKVTCSLVIPMTLAIIHATSKDVPILCYSYEFGELSEEFVENDNLCEEVRLVRQKLHAENKGRFVDNERIGNYKDNLICTLLDPRFKLINFNGSTTEMKKDAELYLRENYKADWSPKSRAYKVVETNAPATNSTPARNNTPASTTLPSSLATSNGKKKKVRIRVIMFLFNSILTMHLIIWVTEQM
jgi:hypothetical protein